MNDVITTINLDRFPRVRLAHLPTPIEPLPRLSAHLGGPAIYVKRDDCTGLALGGNKTRKLEFVMAEALAAGADTIVTTGSVQSNHARQTAAAAARLGLSSVLVLWENVRDSPNFLVSGNVLIDRFLGAEIHIVQVDAFEEVDDVRKVIQAELTAAGREPFFIPCGASTPVGALGYAVAAGEILDHCTTNGLQLDHVVCVAGSGGTQAGLVAGFHALGTPIPVLGFGGGKGPGAQESVWSLVQKTADLLGGLARPARADVVIDGGSFGGGYASIQDATLEAIRLVARLEGLILDPVYTGPAMASLIESIEGGRFSPRDTVLFMHTGGMPGLFGYVDRIAGRIGVYPEH